MAPACVARVHSLLPADWDWSGARASPAALPAPGGGGAAAAASQFGSGARPAAVGSAEDLRERAELQRAYYAFLHSLAHNGLAPVLLRAPPGSLDAALGALMRGAATHVDAGEAVGAAGWGCLGLERVQAPPLLSPRVWRQPECAPARRPTALLARAGAHPRRVRPRVAVQGCARRVCRRWSSW